MRSDSLRTAYQANRSVLVPRRPLSLGSVGMTKKGCFAALVDIARVGMKSENRR